MNRNPNEIPGRMFARAPWILAVLALAALLAATAAPAQDESIATVEAAAEQPAAEPVVDIAFGQDLDRATRALIGPAESFPAGTDRVWCLTRLQNLDAPTTVTHTWYRDGEVMARVELAVGSADWRTWSAKTLLPEWTGAWEVKVLDEAGKVLGARSFVIE